jgi:U3 small nucleolar RNA-associated protein 12
MVANRVMRVVLIPLRKHLWASLQMQKDTIGYNLAALHHLRRRHEAERTAQFFEEEWDEERVQARIAEGNESRW